MFPGNGRVLGIQVDNSYISLPGELFENLNESGNYNVILLLHTIVKLALSVFVASFYYANISYLLPGRE